MYVYIDIQRIHLQTRIKPGQRGLSDLSLANSPPHVQESVGISGEVVGVHKLESSFKCLALNQPIVDEQDERDFPHRIVGI